LPVITPLAKRIGKLADDVEKISDGHVAWEIGKVANALIEEAKQKAPNDPVLSQVEPFTEDPNGRNILRLSPPEVGAILRQVAEAIPPAPMAMPRVVSPDLPRRW
jgi:hypothetical protein